MFLEFQLRFRRLRPHSLLILLIQGLGCTIAPRRASLLKTGLMIPVRCVVAIETLNRQGITGLTIVLSADTPMRTCQEAIGATPTGGRHGRMLLLGGVFSYLLDGRSIKQGLCQNMTGRLLLPRFHRIMVQILLVPLPEVVLNANVSCKPLTLVYPVLQSLVSHRSRAHANHGTATSIMTDL